MSASGAMAITGAVLFVMAVILGIAAGQTRSHSRETRYARVGWAVLALSAACLIAAPWIEVTA